MFTEIVATDSTSLHQKSANLHTKLTQQEVTSLVFSPGVRTLPRGVGFVFIWSFAAEKSERFVILMMRSPKRFLGYSVYKNDTDKLLENSTFFQLLLSPYHLFHSFAIRYITKNDKLELKIINSSIYSYYLYYRGLDKRINCTG